MIFIDKFTNSHMGGCLSTKKSVGNDQIVLSVVISANNTIGKGQHSLPREYDC